MLNKVMLIGNLGSDGVARAAGESSTVANLSLASRRTWKDKEGKRQEDTQWHQVVCWGRQAELAGQLLKKGQLVLVEGRLNTTSWEDPEDPSRTNRRTEVVCERFRILTPKGPGGAPEVEPSEEES